MKLFALSIAILVMAISTILLVVSLTDVIHPGFLKEYRTVIGLAFLLSGSLAKTAFRKFKAG